MKTWKKFAIGGGLALLGAGVLAYDKFQRTKFAFDNLSYFPKISNLNLSLSRVKFNLKVQLTNNVDFDLKLSTAGSVKLTKFFIYDFKGNTLATLKVNDLYKINIPAHSSSETPTLEVEIPLVNLIPLLPIGNNPLQISLTDISNILRYGFEIKTFYGKTHIITTL